MMNEICMTAEALKTYAFALDSDGGIIGQSNDDDPGAELVAKARQYAARNGCDFRTAFEAISADPDTESLLRAYSAAAVVKTYSGGGTVGDPSERVHERALALMERGTCTSYSEAAAMVIREDPELSRAYDEFTGA